MKSEAVGNRNAAQLARVRTSSLRTAVLSALIASAACFAAETANAQADPARITANAVNNAVQSAIDNARDLIFLQRQLAGRVPLGFAADPDFDSTYRALGYAPSKQARANPLYVAPPPPPAGPTIQTAIWGSGTYDREHQTGTFAGTDIGSDARNGTGLGGVDFLISPLSANTAFLVGALGGDFYTTVTTPTGSSSKVRAPTVGVYAAYIAGDFSVDFSSTASFIGTTTGTPSVFLTPSFTAVPTTTVQTMHSNNYNTAFNMHYRFDLGGGAWIEPEAGLGFQPADMGFGGARNGPSERRDRPRPGWHSHGHNVAVGIRQS